MRNDDLFWKCHNTTIFQEDIMIMYKYNQYNLKLYKEIIGKIIVIQ